MRQIFNHYRKGYLRIRLTGFSPERFFNLCRANQIYLWNLQYLDHSYDFRMKLEDYRRVRPLVRKAGVHLHITEKQGLPFVLYRNRRRKWYAAGVLAFFLVLFAMSQFVWNISFEGNRQFTDDMLLQYLDAMDIRYGTWKGGIDCSRLEDSIRSHYQEIIWVSAQVSGTRLMVKIKENHVISQIPKEDTSPQDLMAAKAGVITNMIIRRGKAQVSVGDAVEQGQLLVSGSIPIYNDSQELTEVWQVRADADIYAETTLSQEERIPKTRKERVLTGKMRRGLGLRIGSFDFLWMLPGDKERLWEIKKEHTQLVLLEDFFLPVWIDRITASEYQLVEEYLTTEQLNREIDEINQQIMENFIEKGVQIIGNDVKIVGSDSDYVVRYDYRLEEPIGVGSDMETEETR